MRQLKSRGVGGAQPPTALPTITSGVELQEPLLQFGAPTAVTVAWSDGLIDDWLAGKVGG